MSSWAGGLESGRADGGNRDDERGEVLEWRAGLPLAEPVPAAPECQR